MYVESIKVLKEKYCLEEGFKIEDALPITLLVGDQGCGKSTLLSLMNSEGYDPSKIEVGLSKLGLKGVNTFFFDSESMNPRVAPDHNYYDAKGRSVGIGMAGKLQSFFESHGETLLNFTVRGINQAEGVVMFFDEPESALSVRSQLALVDAIQKASNERQCQFFIATHCMPLIESQEKVYSLEHRKWMTSKEFIDSQKEPKEEKIAD